jgi:hypothetical protein
MRCSSVPALSRQLLNELESIDQFDSKKSNNETETIRDPHNTISLTPVVRAL